MRSGRERQVPIDFAVKIQFGGIVGRGTVLVGQAQNGHNLIPALMSTPWKWTSLVAVAPLRATEGKTRKNSSAAAGTTEGREMLPL